MLHDVSVLVCSVVGELDFGDVAHELEDEAAQHADCITIVAPESNG